ncbi:hypothetical protein [Mycobacterium hubeiense]|uniref:hypothetical protein n=1 Tax=Mycobacterium hubeiense TaxID=1867256 RepID=UPI001156D6C9|nr:hypothetical protein [Mycobacterium sp. QGD 101]
MQNAPNLLGQLPNFALLAALSVIGPVVSTGGAVVVAGTEIVNAAGTLDPVEIANAVLAVPAYIADGILNGGYGFDLDLTPGNGLTIVPGGLLSRFRVVLNFPNLTIFAPGPVGAALNTRQTIADVLAGTVPLSAAAVDEIPGSGETVRLTAKPPAATTVDANSDDLGESWDVSTAVDPAKDDRTAAGGTDLTDGNKAEPGRIRVATARSGERIRAAVEDVRGQVRSSVKKFGESVRRAAGFESRDRDDKTQTADVDE